MLIRVVSKVFGLQQNLFQIPNWLSFYPPTGKVLFWIMDQNGPLEDFGQINKLVKNQQEPKEVFSSVNCDDVSGRVRSLERKQRAAVESSAEREIRQISARTEQKLAGDQRDTSCLLLLCAV